MPPTLGDRLIHIIEAIDTIRSIIAGKSSEDISNHLYLRLALERLLEIICEASRHVPSDIKAGETNIDWQRIIDLGNLLRHAYHRVDVSLLMTIAQADLPPLKAFVERVLQDERS